MDMRGLSFILFFFLLADPTAAQWTAFAPGNTNGTVIDYQWHNGELYAGGFFTQINGDNALSVAKWNGNNWVDVGGGLTDGLHHLEVIDSTLYAVRYEMQVDSNWVYYLDNGAWQKLGSGFYLSGANAGQFYTPSMYDVREYNGEVYACGEFNENAGIGMERIAKWDGADWSALGAGLTNPFFGQTVYPHQMLVHNGLLYVCGNFQQAGGVQVNGVAAWDGSAWSALGAGFNSTVYALGVYNNELYAGGDFSMSGSTALGAVAKWDGANWVSPGFGFQYSSPNGYLFVHTIEELNNELFVMGGFDRVVPDGQSPLMAGSIVSFDGQNLDLLAGGANNDVESITDFQGQVLIGGFFSTAGNGVTASKLALYDSLATGLSVNSPFSPDLHSFPNPFQDFLHVDGIPDGARFELLDAKGALHRSGEWQGPLGTADLEAGLYFLRVYGDSFERVLKVLKP